MSNIWFFVISGFGFFGSLGPDPDPPTQPLHLYIRVQNIPEKFFLVLI